MKIHAFLIFKRRFILIYLFSLSFSGDNISTAMMHFFTTHLFGELVSFLAHIVASYQARVLAKSSRQSRQSHERFHPDLYLRQDCPNGTGQGITSDHGPAVRDKVC